MRRHLMTVLLPAILLAGCSEPAPPASNDADPESPAASAVSPRPVADEDDVVVSTNEPFWQARVEGDVIVLGGIDAPERRLSDASSSMTMDGRRIVARDAAGEVVVTVRRMRCQDDMSGAMFPMTGLLMIDGQGPIRGCARPASMPPPVPSDEGADVATGDAAIPARFQGRWASDATACANPDASIEGLTIAAAELRFHESLGVPVSVARIDDDTLEVMSTYDGEGERWEATQTLRLEDDGTALVIDGPDDASMRRVRCGG